MAYPIILYDATSGSDTAPADAIATGSAASGTGAATTIELGGTFDLTDAADDDSDYIWCSTTAGQRHLFQITSFTGGVATCTAVVVAEAIGATTFSGANWHINGSRKTLEGDTSRTDSSDWMSGWTAQLDAGTYVTTREFTPGENDTASAAKPTISIVAKNGAVSRPIIDRQSNGYQHHLIFSEITSLEVSGIKFTCSAGGSNSYARVTSSSTSFLDCVFDVSGSTVDKVFYVQYTGSFIINNCYVTGATQYGLLCESIASVVSIVNSVFDGQNTYFATAGIYSAAWLAMLGSASIRCTGEGVRIRTNLPDKRCLLYGNTAAGNTSNGFAMVDETPSADSTPEHYYALINNISAANGAFGFVTPSTSNKYMFANAFVGNATWGNTSGAYSGQITASVDGVACTVDPFTNSGTGDYTLNNTAGGGADLRGAAYPATLPDGT